MSATGFGDPAQDPYTSELFKDEIAAEEKAVQEEEKVDELSEQERDTASEADAEGGTEDEGGGESAAADAGRAEAQEEEGEEGEGEERVEEESVDALKARIAELEKQSQGLRRDLVDWRAKAKEWAATQPMVQAGGPGPPATPPAASVGTPTPDGAAGQASPGLLVQVSPDGQQVYVPRDEVKQLIQETTQPSPQEQAQMQYAQERQGAYQQFAVGAEDRETAQETMQRVLEADQWLMSKVQEMGQHGVQLQPAQVPQALAHFGVLDEMATRYPDVAPYAQELMGAWMTRNSMWESNIVQRIYDGSRAAKQKESETPAEELADVSHAPKAMARKGGSRSPSKRSEESEFQKLDEAYNKDPVAGLNAKQFERWRHLARKLKVDGWEDL